MAEEKGINWAQIGINFLAIVIPIVVSLVIWGSSIEKRLTHLETMSNTYASAATVQVIANNIQWIRQEIGKLSEKTDRLVDSLNMHMKEHRDN